MKKHSKSGKDSATLREKIIGLGERSIKKSYYPQLREQLEKLRESERRFRELAEELRRSNENLKQFAYVASHDLQAPLRNVEGFANMLARRYKGRLDPKADEIIGYISQGVQNMQELILDILEYSKVGSGGREFIHVNVRQCVEKAILDLEAIIRERNAHIKYGEDLPTISGDETMLIRLFHNLLSNAIKFSDEEPEISITAKRAGNEYVFAVADKGIGIEDAYQQKIFEVFQRLHRQGKYQGTGIGLAICKKIVEHHSGRIWVESEPGKGSTFFFTLPTF